MTENTAPVRWLRLAGSTDSGTGPQAAPVPDASTEAGTETVLMSVGTGVPMKAQERAVLTAKHWGSLAANGAGQMWLHPDRLLHDMWHKGPAPMNGHVAYVKSSAWVPEELRGHKSGGFLKWLGWIHYALIAWPLKLLALGLSALADRALRFYIALPVVIALAFAVVLHVH